MQILLNGKFLLITQRGIPVTDNAVYDGSSTNSLQIKNPSLAYHNYKFRVILNRIGNACPKTSNEITLTVNPLPIPKENPTNLKQCDSDPDKKTTFNLTLVEKNISDNPTDRFEYYTKECRCNNRSSRS